MSYEASELHAIVFFTRNSEDGGLFYGTVGTVVR
jgi:hypothetical protein